MCNVKPALFYIALIFGLWTVYVATVYPFVESRPDVAARVLLNESIRFGIFVLPIWIYLKFIARENPFRYLKLSENVARGIFWGVGVGIIYAALVLARAAFFLEGGAVNFRRVPLEAWLTAITIAVFIEEMAFRGFLLRQFEGAANFWTANALTACLFVAVHFPGWILLSDSPLLAPVRLIAMAEILFLGLLLGYVFKRSGSLWSCIIVHAANNLLSTALFG
jgi:hypothetical protein